MGLSLTAPIHDLAGHSGIADALMKLAASDLIAAVALLLLAAWLTRPDGVRACVAAVLGGAAALAGSVIVGMIWNRPRPFVAGHYTPLISHAADASFPSDHVAFLAAVATALWFSSRRLGAAGWILALIVGFARVYVGVHYVSDVLGGALLGAVTGAVCWMLTCLFRGALARLDDGLRHLRLRPGL